ncbi:hypothetical protein TNCV_1404041 [Trichonephila clavipes]|nr:hypothetical protein TNCV_1404041 [Trichonephila clavipes]
MVPDEFAGGGMLIEPQHKWLRSRTCGQRVMRSNPSQCRIKLISVPGRRRSTGPLGTGGSKFIIRKSGQVQLIRALPDPCALTPSARRINQHPPCRRDDTL